MSKQEPSDQVKFLVSCIGHTSNGRPDFQSVATDLGIVSKAAAQKRYERMLKAHGITTKGGSASTGNTEDKSGLATPPKRKARAAPAGSAKKKGKPTPTKKSSSDDDEDSKPLLKPKKEKEVKTEDETISASSLTDAPASASSEDGDD